ncbi:TPA: type II toxin-antitoxin system RelE/ParE family toxin [Pluralibacter gergoviae]|uniref:Diaminopimelate decarboxylase n=1 Tax=Pluralibacter gergoviae TaxID=61647 RepID=A0A0J5M669_PLUGE|nr:type II toxin-antitoxin system RelE/ParE family toxin [Pluralibacter gergoviae]KMK16089.1 diaminopimelate decarboxylase [Pluralibacter gergoviae]KMK27321.1 diaminopimelate decarboxylase [Pluralibacter gergoviae]MBL3695589.1 diaminopimelate decarboxylase [Pluralibacter gergoviae]HDS1154039.1 type II toxin-antitoxin system RelE/ParE family toxin [Pluralibacter gergoviae]
MWNIQVTETYKLWHQALSAKDQARVLAMLDLLEKEGPRLGRPYADTIKGSRFSNMKELRIQRRDEPLRIFYVFSPEREGILLCAGNKSGDDKRFYDIMIPLADEEYTEYLNHFYQSR